MTARVAVVGGGVAGLAAALRLRELRPSAEIIVYEQAAALGGKVRTGELAGLPVEQGAEAFLVRDPVAADVARRVGLGDALVAPATSTAAVALGGSLLPIPPGTLLGVPGDPHALRGSGIAEVVREPPGTDPLLAPEEDVAVGPFIRRRLGDEVVDRLVDPMLGGTYAGHADELSLRATMPALASAAERQATVVGAAGAVLGAAPKGGPVFQTVLGGMTRLVTAMADTSGARIRLGATVRELARTETGWRLVVGATRDPRVETADAVVLATPARPAARLLDGVSPAAAAEVGALDYASLALVVLALPGAVDLPAMSGFLVPALEGRAVKAVTFFSRKWAHLRHDDVTLVRASVGRYGDERLLQRDDDELLALVREELLALLGRPLPEPVDAWVVRWGGALPQYAPGHPGRVRRARAALAAHGTLALAGAAYDGIGIPACVRSGVAAADQVLL